MCDQQKCLKDNVLLEVEVQRLKRRNIFMWIAMPLFSVLAMLYTYRVGKKQGVDMTVNYVTNMIEEAIKDEQEA